jgi:hypothetical protein
VSGQRLRWNVAGFEPQASEARPHQTTTAGEAAGRWDSLSMNGYSPSLPIASTGQDSIASATWAISSSFSGCLWTNE